MATRVAFYTFGCRLNQAETAVMEQGFSPGEFEIVDFRDRPDLLVVNTCTVTENGDADTRRLVNRARRVNPDVRIALVGCQAQVQKERLLELPNVRWVIGNAEKMDTARLISHSHGSEPEVIAPTIRKEPFTVPFVGLDRHHTRANLKIQDGCDFFCSFCEIPYARGRARSREFDDILAEARALAAAGHREQVLTGINIGTYDEGGRTIVDVLDALDAVPGLERIRISSIEPTTIDTRVIERMAAGGKLCRHLHIPLQAGSDAVLERMLRKYDVAEFHDFVMMVHDAVPGVCLGTDVIVGFPGESDAAFEETWRLLLEMPFAYIHVFSYSQRDHARTRRFDDALNVPRAVIAERSRRLRELSQRKRRIYNECFLGREERVLFESQRDGWWNGLTDTYIRVRVRSDDDLKNRMLPVLLERTDGQAVVGTLA